MTGTLTVLAPDGAPEIVPGDDLAAVLLETLAAADIALQDGDIVAVTSKVVAKAEGRVVTGDRAAATAAETVHVVARRGETVIVRTRHGLTLAAAGVDASNVPSGTVVLLPEDPDASAGRIRTGIGERSGRTVGVLVTDTAGRAWRRGQNDLAIGAAGLVVAESFLGRTDRFGNVLHVTEPAVADELASAAELAQGKLTGRPFAVLRGRGDLVLPPGEPGPGARALVRPAAEDLFGLGAREAVVRALAGDRSAQPLFGSPASLAEVRAALVAVVGEQAVTRDAQGLRATGEPRVLHCLALALGWEAAPAGPEQVRFTAPAS